MDKEEAFDRIVDIVTNPRSIARLPIDSQNFAKFVGKLEEIIDQVTEE